jgi:hypothetical protein
LTCAAPPVGPLSAALGAPTAATAVDLNTLWPDLGLPGFKISPFISQRVEYESNVFQAPSGSQDDVIFKPARSGTR